MRRQEHGESSKSFAGNITHIAHRANAKVTDYRMLESIMIQVFANGLRYDRSRTKVILQTPQNLTEAPQYARILKAEVRVSQNHSAPLASISVNAITFYNCNTR